MVIYRVVAWHDPWACHMRGAPVCETFCCCDVRYMYCHMNSDRFEFIQHVAVLNCIKIYLSHEVTCCNDKLCDSWPSLGVCMGGWGWGWGWGWGVEGG